MVLAYRFPLTLWRQSFWQVAAASLLAGGVLLCLIWLLQSLRFLDFLVNKGLGFGVFLHLTGLLVPQLLTIILPLGILAGAVMVCRRQQDDHETTAALAAGASPWVLLAPLLGWAWFGVALGYALLLQLLPASTTAFKDLQNDLRTRQGQLLLEEGTFNPLGENLMVYVRKRLTPSSFEQLLVHDTRNPTNPVTWYAQSGALAQATSGMPYLVLFNGMRQETSLKQVSMLEFASYNLDLSSQFGQAQGAPRMPEVEEGNLANLWARAKAEQTSPQQAAELQAEAFKRLTWPLLPIPLVLLASAALLRPPKRKQSSLRGVMLAAVGGVVCVGGQFALLAQAQGGAGWALGAMVGWPVLLSLLALVWYRKAASA